MKKKKLKLKKPDKRIKEKALEVKPKRSAPGWGGARPGSGYPKKEIDIREFENLCRIQATIEEIAAWFDMNTDTLEKRIIEHYGEPFAEVFKKKRGKGKISLRRRQFQAALAGETSMLIFLGKQWLDQADKKEIKGSWKNPFANMTDEELLRENERIQKLENNHSQNLNEKPNMYSIEAVREVIEIEPTKTDKSGSGTA